MSEGEGAEETERAQEKLGLQGGRKAGAMGRARVWDRASKLGQQSRRENLKQASFVEARMIHGMASTWRWFRGTNVIRPGSTDRMGKVRI